MFEMRSHSEIQNDLQVPGLASAESHVFLMRAKSDRGVIIPLIIGSIHLEKGLMLFRDLGGRSLQEHQKPKELRRYWNHACGTVSTSRALDSFR